MRVSRFICQAASTRVGVVALSLMLGSSSFAQDKTPGAPSPVAPGDLSKPVFDTRTRVYDSVTSLDKAASTVVAEVEGRPITMGDVGDAIRALPPAMAQLPFNDLYPTVVEQLVRQEVLVVRAQQQGADEDPAIRRRVRAAADRELAEEYMRWAISKQITESELLARYDRDIAGKPGPEEVRLRVILTGSEKEANDLIAELRGGVDFATVARRASKDTTAPTGGDLGFKSLDQLNAQVGAAAFTLPVGQITPYPVRGTAGWFVVKVEERRQQPTSPYASMREQLLQTLMKEKVGPFVETAFQGLKLRRYNFTGTEADATKQEAR
jgi:peptidyl-prolyl cis-trans isomerase C